MKGIFDLTFSLSMMPLKRSTVIDLGVEPAVRFSFFKYGSWALQAVVFAPKAFWYVYRSIKAGITVYSVFHFIDLLQITLGLALITATILKAEQAQTYWNFHHHLCKSLGI